MYQYKATVQRIYDGDTIYVNIDLGFDTWLMRQPVRLLDIDAPELRGEERPFGIISRDWLISQIPVGTEIKINTFQDKDKYGRYLAIIEFNGRNLNEEMIQLGYAVPYKG